MNKLIDDLRKIIDDSSILINEPMKNHTSFKIGGNADYFIKVKNVKQLIELQKIAKQYNTNFQIIGNGSNILVLDNGIRGIVAKLDFNRIEIDKSKQIIKVSADFSVSKLARLCAEKELTGAEFLCGIPGTIGGAIKMNAGAYGSEIKDILLNTTVLDINGNIKYLSNSEQKFGYRDSIFKNNEFIILETELKLNIGNAKDINNKMNEMMENRKEHQPIEFPSAGSTFKRKNNIITAKLIDECGLKGYSIGDAEISTKHAGFIINKGNATAKDVLALVEHIKKEVNKRFKEEIELEVLVIGEK